MLGRVAAAICDSEVINMTRTHFGILIVALGNTTACVYGPFYDDTIDSTGSSVTFNLYATSPSALMTAECANHYSPFVEFGSKIAATSPITLNGETIYSASLTKIIPESCWDFGFGKPVTWLRFFQKSGGNTYGVQVFDHNGPACISEHVGDGEGLITAGWACRRTESSQLRLFANR
jgi:hypothetical protein